MEGNLWSKIEDMITSDSVVDPSPPISRCQEDFRGGRSTVCRCFPRKAKKKSGLQGVRSRRKGLGAAGVPVAGGKKEMRRSLDPRQRQKGEKKEEVLFSVHVNALGKIVRGQSSCSY